RSATRNIQRRILAPEPIHSHRVVTLNAGAACDQHARYVQGRGFAQIVSVRLERQTQQADSSAFENLQLVQKLFDDTLALTRVGGARSRHDLHGEVVFGSGRHQGRTVLSETRSAPADARLQKAFADAGVEADAARHLCDVRADLVRE